MTTDVLEAIARRDSAVVTEALVAVILLTWLYLLVAAGIYQLTPLKDACLRHCRSPLVFITEHWRPGTGGAFRTGLYRGAYCVGGCWVIMGLLFYGGVISLWWIVGLPVLMLLGKALTMGRGIASLSGIGFLVWGGWIVLDGLAA